MARKKRREYKGRFSDLSAAEKHRLRSKWARKAARTRKIVRQMYADLIAEAESGLLFRAPDDRHRDFTFDVDAIANWRERERSPLFLQSEYDRANDRLDDFRGESVRIAANFLVQSNQPGSQVASKIWIVHSDPFRVKSKEDFYDAYYGIARDFIEDEYERADHYVPDSDLQKAEQSGVLPNLAVIQELLDHEIAEGETITLVKGDVSYSVSEIWLELT